MITEQSIIQHGILKDIENKENENTISSVASLLSNIPQCACTECDVPGEVFLLSHCEYQQIQTAYCHCLFHNLVFTPSSLIHYLHDTSDVFWLIGLLVDYTPSNQNGFSRIRLRDLTSDIIIQLSCEEWVERFPLGSIVCVTNLSCKNGDRIVFSKFSSIFCIPQTEFLQSILPSPPRTLFLPSFTSLLFMAIHRGRVGTLTTSLFHLYSLQKACYQQSYSLVHLSSGKYQ